MPSRQEHVNKADGNAEFALSLPLSTQTQIDWALISLFYAALHYVEAYLAPTCHHKSHQTRDSYIGRDSDLRRIYSEYQELKYYGFNARYEMCGFKLSDVRDNAASAFETIKAHIKPLL